MNNIEFITATKNNVTAYMEDLIEIENSSGLPIIWDEAHFLFDLKEKWKCSRLIIYNKRCIGYAVISKKAPESSHIHRFVVKDSFRGNGAGNLLLEHIKAILKDKFEYLTLYVDIKNKKAYEFYQKNCFREVIQFDGNYLMILKLGK